MLPARFAPILAAALVCAVVHVHVRAADAVFTPQRIAELRNVTAAAISPDGKHTAYTLSVPRQPGLDDDGEAWTELWVVGAEADAKPRAFVSGKAKVSAVRWSPDGRQIAFLTKRSDDKFRSLYFIPLQYWGLVYMLLGVFFTLGGVAGLVRKGV